MKNLEKTILIYGLQGMPLMTLAQNCKKSGIHLRIVSDTETSYTVDKLIASDELPPQQELHLPGKYALIAGFERNLGEPSFLLNQAQPGIIKSVRTEHNAVWRFADLCFAIQQEQDAINSMRKMKK